MITDSKDLMYEVGHCQARLVEVISGVTGLHLPLVGQAGEPQQGQDSQLLFLCGRKEEDITGCRLIRFQPPALLRWRLVLCNV